MWTDCRPDFAGCMRGDRVVSARPCLLAAKGPPEHPRQGWHRPPGRARAPGGPGGSKAPPRASPGGRRARRPASAAAPRAAAGRWEGAAGGPRPPGGARVGARGGGAASGGRRRHAPSPPGPGRRPCWRACCRSTPSRRVGRPGPAAPLNAQGTKASALRFGLFAGLEPSEGPESGPADGARSGLLASMARELGAGGWTRDNTRARPATLFSQSSISAEAVRLA